MSQADISTAIAAFLANQGVTRCPTACVTRTMARLSETDRAALADYAKAREAARQAKLGRGVAA